MGYRREHDVHESERSDMGYEQSVVGDESGRRRHWGPAGWAGCGDGGGGGEEGGVLEAVGRGQVGQEEVGLDGGGYQVCAAGWGGLLRHGVGAGVEAGVEWLLRLLHFFGTLAYGLAVPGE